MVRQLEVAAVSDDGAHVLLAPVDGSGRVTHQIRIDDRLVAAIRGDLDTSDRRPSELTPKEIQARLRAGHSIEEVAKAARIPVARVMKYAVPVESERSRIVEQARATAVTRGRGKLTNRPLGEAVDRRLTTTNGFRPESVEWSARRREDGTWSITVSYQARGAKTASWLWQPAVHELTALDVAGARLSADEPEPTRRRAAKRAPSTRTRRAQPAQSGRTGATRTESSRTQSSRTQTAKSARSAGRKAAATGRRRSTATANGGPVEPTPAPTRAPSWDAVLFGAAAAQQPLTVRRVREPAAKANHASAAPATRARKAAAKKTSRAGRGR